MAEVIVMPRQGNTVESCLIMKWRVAEGDAVEPKTVVADVETDKATFEIEAGCAGTVLKLLYEEGSDVLVMQPLAIVGQVGENISALCKVQPQVQSHVQSADKSAVPGEVGGLVADVMAMGAEVYAREEGVKVCVSPRARRYAQTQGVWLNEISGSGPMGRVVERDIKRATEGRAGLTPVALEKARAGDVVIPSRGSGIGGRVLSLDIAQATTRKKAEGATAVVSQLPTAEMGAYTTTILKGIRKVVAERMAASLATTSQFTLHTSAVAVQLQKLRAGFKASDSAQGISQITMGDLVVYATIRTLLQFPFMNAHKKGLNVYEFAEVHMGIACDTPRGLMVPVVKRAHTLSLAELSQKTRQLAEACRSGTIAPDDLTGSTFTISNLGASGIEMFTPVINAPEVAILGVCSIIPKPVMQGGEVTWLPSIGLSLTVDHQAVDGAPAARFLKSLCDTIATMDSARLF